MRKSYLKETIAVMLMVLAFAVSAYAQAEVGESAIWKLVGWLSRVIGGGVVAIGIIWTGIMMAGHDPEALKKGVFVIIGGILIFLAKTIVVMIAGWTGTTIGG